MRYCDKCKVNIADEINHCPLCGRDISTDIANESFLCYPDNKVFVNKRNIIINIMFWIAIISMIISIFIELLIFKRLNYNWYVITGAALFIVDFIMPMKFRWSFSALTIVVALTICAYILFLELFTNSFGWGLNYVIPMFILFMALYSTFITIIRNYYRKYEYVICLLIFSVLGVIVFLYNLFTNAVIWPALVAFLTSVTCFIGFLLFRFKKVKNELEKSFFI